MYEEQPLLSHTQYQHSYSSLKRPELIRLYTIWPGKQRFLFGGRLMLGPNSGCFFISLFFLCIVPILLTIFSTHSSHAMNNLFTQFHLKKGYLAETNSLFIIITFSLLLISVVLLLLTGLTDPGILPPTPVSQFTPEPLPGLEIEPDGTLAKHCATCNFYRLPRAKHCRYCDSCVMNFDHHCPFIGSCVGSRNYPYFLLLLLSMTSYLVFLLFSCSISILNHIIVVFSLSTDNFLKLYNQFYPDYVITDVDFVTPMDKLAVIYSLSLCCIMYLAYALITSVSVFPLVSYHINALSMGLTTNEEVRNTYPNGSPYNLGFWNNVTSVFLSRPPPAYNPRWWVTTGGIPVLSHKCTEEDALKWTERGVIPHGQAVRHWTIPPSPEEMVDLSNHDNEDNDISIFATKIYNK